MAKLIAVALAALVLGVGASVVLNGGGDALPPSYSAENLALEQRIDRIEAALERLLDRPLRTTDRGDRRLEVGQGDGSSSRSDSSGGDGQLARMERRLEVLEDQVRGLARDPIERGYDYLGSSSARLRREGIEMLERVGRSDPRASAAILAMLGDSDSGVREQALEAIEDMRDRDAIPQVVAALRDADSDVREQAIRSLEELVDDLPVGATASAEAVAALTSRTSDEDPGVRARAVEALSGLRSAASTRALIRSLDDAEPRVRGEAIQALGRSQDPAAVAPLRALYDAGPSSRSLDLAISLWQLGDRVPFQREAAGLVETATSGQDERARGRAVDTLGRYAANEYREVLTRALEDPSARVRRAAERALRRAR